MENPKLLIALAFVSAIGLVASSGCNSSSTSDQASLEAKGLKSEKEIAQAAMDAEAAEEELSKSRRPASQKAKGNSKSNLAKKSSAESIYLVQVGTFKIEQNAAKILEKLKSAGLPAFQKKIERENGVVLFAVRIEPTPNRAEAEKFLASAKQATGQAPLILSVGQ